MSVGTVLLIVLILLLIGVFPAWPHAQQWGSGPSIGVGTAIVVVLILWLMGVIR